MNASITGDLLRDTAAVIEGQPVLPRSPGILDGSNPLLCAGAAVVYQAARRVLDAKELYRLATDMVSAGSEEIVRSAAKLQLDTRLVHLIVLNNDACGDERRRPHMVTFLRELAADLDGAAAIKA